MCTCALEMCSTHNSRKTHSLWSTSHTPNFSTIHPAVSKMRKRGAHVSTCSCTPPQAFAKRLRNESLTIHQISAQCAQPLTGYEKWAHLPLRTCSSADAPIHNLCRNMHRYMVSKHKPNLVIIDRPIPELYAQLPILTLFTCHALSAKQPLRK